MPGGLRPPQERPLASAKVAGTLGEIYVFNIFNSLEAMPWVRFWLRSFRFRFSRPVFAAGFGWAKWIQLIT
ncbi:hypothetical protein SAMN05444161_7417 [Rhizobiales bacterium GAS191]|nr:hypothetical protein SAMN05444161_7417 [Rhizobiales bacterium GAS191]